MAGSPDTRPNVLVFFCDQLRPDLLGCYGGDLVRTPNIDALAADCTVFENGFTPTAICSPARASLMTGLYAHKHHMFNNSTRPYSYCEHLRPDMRMVQDWAADETDYETAYYGKWHIGPPQDLFDSRFEHAHRPPYPGRTPAFATGHGHPNTRLGPLVQSFGGGKAGTLDVPMDEFPDVMVARYSTDFLRSRSGERPFLLYSSLPGPHSPWMVPEEWGIRYDPSEIPDWPNRYDDFDGKPINQKKLRIVEDLRQEQGRDETLKDLLSACFSYLELVDAQVGEVVSNAEGAWACTTTRRSFSDRRPRRYGRLPRLPEQGRLHVRRDLPRADALQAARAAPTSGARPAGQPDGRDGDNHAPDGR